MKSLVLYTIPFSHYCEKARWSLERMGLAFEERGHIPMVTRMLAIPRGATTVPFLLSDEGMLDDSTAIADYAHRHRTRSAGLFSEDPVIAQQALDLEDRFDRRLGVATRAWGYSYLLDMPALTTPMFAKQVPALEAAAVKRMMPFVSGFIRKGLRIKPETRAWAANRIDEDFAAVEELLRDGRRYLCGDALSIADITFASLAAPALGPAEYGGPLPKLEAFDGPMRTALDRWRDTMAGQFALRIYREERSHQGL
ncbi:MAG: glutathione S-transferase N-terminal domain-containing protein [Deltaproteobacteria bacterium]|nr:glutathione S-transferase N-terminal domain-containing protein [Deltaproteobacteria bacterium]